MVKFVSSLQWSYDKFQTMIISLKFGERAFQIDSEDPFDISIPLTFNGPQPNAYGVEPAIAEACEYGDLVGDTRRGGSCNFERVSLIPHCNGTHTECVGHVTNERISVRDCLRDAFISAKLISVEPELEGELYGTDLVITANAIERSCLAVVNPRSDTPPADKGDPDIALVIRTLPNDDRKLTRKYGEIIPPFFTTEAMEYIVGIGVTHLLVDMPSIDRIHDEGKLSNHRIFWNIEPGSFEVNEKTRTNSTVTELIYVPNEVQDGEYLLNLQIAPFASDASPSRPLLFKTNRETR